MYVYDFGRANSYACSSFLYFASSKWQACCVNQMIHTPQKSILIPGWKAKKQVGRQKKCQGGEQFRKPLYTFTSGDEERSGEWTSELTLRIGKHSLLVPMRIKCFWERQSASATLWYCKVRLWGVVSRYKCVCAEQIYVQDRTLCEEWNFY